MFQAYTNLNTNNPVLVWVDYKLASQYTVLSKVKKIQTVAPAISIEEVPPLTIQAEGPQELTLQWPESAAAVNLYHATDLTPPVTWILVTNAPTLSNGQWSVTLPIGTDPSGFYRLVPQ